MRIIENFFGLEVMVIRRGRTNIFKVSSFFRQPLFYGFDVSKGILKEISLMREELAEKTGTKKVIFQE